MIIPKSTRLSDFVISLKLHTKQGKERLHRKYLKVHRYCIKVRQYISGNIDWIVCIVLGISIGILSFFMPQSNGDKGEILYLLSAISQVLAALLALVFTITLMFVSMGKKYTLLNKIFNTGTARLMSAFIIGIIIPLMLLKADSESTGYNILISSSLGLATFCIAAILPYLKNLNNIIMYDVGIPNLISELHESRAAEQYTRADTAVYDLLDLGKSAIKNKREDPVWKISIQISNYVKLAISRRGGILSSFSPNTSIYALSEMGTRAINAQMDNVAVQFLYDLKDVSILLIPKGFDLPVKDAIFNIHKIGILAMNHKLIFTSLGSLTSLLYIVYESPPEKYRENCPENAYEYFGVCAANFEKYYPEEADRACDDIRLMNIDINQILSKRRRDRINRQNKDLAGFVDKFIERFNSN